MDYSIFNVLVLLNFLTNWTVTMMISLCLGSTLNFSSLWKSQLSIIKIYYSRKKTIKDWITWGENHTRNLSIFQIIKLPLPPICIGWSLIFFEPKSWSLVTGIMAQEMDLSKVVCWNWNNQIQVYKNGKFQFLMFTLVSKPFSFVTGELERVKVNILGHAKSVSSVWQQEFSKIVKHHTFSSRESTCIYCKRSKKQALYTSAPYLAHLELINKTCLANFW